MNLTWRTFCDPKLPTSTVPMSDPGRTNYDAKIFDVAPWSGAAGPDYVRVFKPDWLALARRKTDDYGSWHEHIMGTLPGCSPAATAVASGGSRTASREHSGMTHIVIDLLSS